MSAGHECLGGTRGSYIVSSAAEVLWMSVVHGMRGIGGVCEMCMYLARPIRAPDVTANKWCSCHSGFGKLLCKMSRNLTTPEIYERVWLCIIHKFVVL